MTGRIHRFDFGTLRDFRGPLVLETLRQTQREEAELTPPPAPTFSADELEAARMAGKKEGYAEGFTAGQQDAHKSFDQRQQEAQELIRQLGGEIHSLQRSYQALLSEESQQLSGLVAAIAKKVAAEALDARGETVILALIERCLPVVFSKPKLVVELNPDVFASTLDRIESMVRECGIEAEIQFRANESLARSDVRLDWGTGQMARDTGALWQEIEQIIANVPLTPNFDTLPSPQEQH